MYGNADYIGEPVSQIEHMCQCAQLAEASGWDEEMILAAFFHDIGHLYEHIAEEKTEHMDNYGTVDHETLGAEFIRKVGFGERMAKLVASHVNAKRYLVAKYPDYRARLSEASMQTLNIQGGPMTDEEIASFESDPLHKEYIQLRYWDEQAKMTNNPLPDLQHYRNMMINQLEKK
jgi:phosphonate degradation associated HDIG domain protein